jgi:hypothetical protein
MRSLRTIENSLHNLRGLFQFFCTPHPLDERCCSDANRASRDCLSECTRGLRTARCSESKYRGGYGKVALAFEANEGQTTPQVKFVSRGPGYSLFLTGRK